MDARSFLNILNTLVMGMIVIVALIVSYPKKQSVERTAMSHA